MQTGTVTTADITTTADMRGVDVFEMTVPAVVVPEVDGEGVEIGAGVNTISCDGKWCQEEGRYCFVEGYLWEPGFLNIKGAVTHIAVAATSHTGGNGFNYDEHSQVRTMCGLFGNMYGQARKFPKDEGGCRRCRSAALALARSGKRRDS